MGEGLGVVAEVARGPASGLASAWLTLRVPRWLVFFVWRWDRAAWQAVVAHRALDHRGRGSEARGSPFDERGDALGELLAAHGDVDQLLGLLH